MLLDFGILSFGKLGKGEKLSVEKKFRCTTSRTGCPSTRKGRRRERSGYGVEWGRAGRRGVCGKAIALRGVEA
jgi:hypothetical protein